MWPMKYQCILRARQFFFGSLKFKHSEAFILLFISNLANLFMTLPPKTGLELLSFLLQCQQSVLSWFVLMERHWTEVLGKHGVDSGGWRINQQTCSDWDSAARLEPLCSLSCILVSQLASQLVSQLIPVLFQFSVPDGTQGGRPAQQPVPLSGLEG